MDNKELIAEAKRLYRLGVSRRVIAAKLNIDRETVAYWLTPEGKTPAPFKSYGTTEDGRRAIAERDERLARYGHEYNDLNVMLLGDPPRHRSALAQRGQQ